MVKSVFITQIYPRDNTLNIIFSRDFYTHLYLYFIAGEYLHVFATASKNLERWCLVDFFFFLIWCKKQVHFNSFGCGYLASSISFVEETIFSPLCILGTLVKNQLIAYMLIYFGFFILFHWSICLHECAIKKKVKRIYKYSENYFWMRFIHLAKRSIMYEGRIKTFLDDYYLENGIPSIHFLEVIRGYA